MHGKRPSAPATRAAWPYSSATALVVWTHVNVPNHCAIAQVGADTVKKAREAAAGAGDAGGLAPANSQEAKILSALRGGVLEVKLHRPHVHGGLDPAK